MKKKIEAYLASKGYDAAAIHLSDRWLEKLYLEENISLKLIAILFGISPWKAGAMAKKLGIHKGADHSSSPISNLIKCGNENSFLGKSEKEKEEIAKKISRSHLSRSPERVSFSNEKRRISCEEKYGIGNAAQLDSAKEKAKASCLDKFGAICPMRNAAVRAKAGIAREELSNLADRNEDFWRSNFVENGFFLAEEAEKHHGYSRCQVLRIKKEFGIKEPAAHVWKTQLAAADFIRGFHPGEIAINDRNAIRPKELDIFLPRLRIAIEINGWIWHSFAEDDSQFSYIFAKKEDRDHLLRKTILCGEKGIRLIHLWDFEWPDPGERILAEIVSGRESFPRGELILDRRFAPLSIPGREASFSPPRRIEKSGRFSWDCGSAEFR
jgi:hypothetical protein